MSEPKELTEAQKIMIGYLVTGNSAHDLARQLVEQMHLDEEVEEIKSEQQSIEDWEDIKEWYLQAYEDVADRMNSPIVG